MVSVLAPNRSVATELSEAAPAAQLDLHDFSFVKIGDGDFVVLRGWRATSPLRILVTVPASERSNPAAQARLEHAFALRDALEPSWAARPLALLRYHGHPALVTEDPGGELLSTLVGTKLPLRQSLRVACGLAAALRGLHAEGLIHRDIKPAHILVDQVSGRAWLTGTGLALRAPRHRQPPQPPDTLAGTLAYMAPEQTGRMNRSMDSRSDLYSLGITLYQLLTGQLPFVSDDPMEVVHGHIARLARPALELSPELPVVVSAIVMKLLAKNAENRYQTSAGLEADLRSCLSQLDDDRAGTLADFPLGTHDASSRLLVPEKLYGREQDTALLLDALDDVLKHGRPRLAVVSGYSGIGKSSVVHELHKVLVPPRGLFSSGKYDQYKRDIPYATLAQAFQGLVRMVLSRSERELSVWRTAIAESVGTNGQLILNLVPELEAILGKQPPVPELPPDETQKRFQKTIERFIGVFARPAHPLVLFLDDLQWLDAASLQLLSFILSESELQYLLLIGAYRDNEVGPDHPLARTLRGLRESMEVPEIVLRPLRLDDVSAMVADALRCSRDRARPLARLLREKTGGNPFFTIQFFAALAEEELLFFDPAQSAWAWDLTRIRAKGYTDNVVTLMEGKLRRLGPRPRAVLQDLACLGNYAEIGRLALIREQSEARLETEIGPAISAGLVFRTGSVYSLLHDRVQEAAYASIPDADKAAAHLRIGRLLAAHTPLGKLEEEIFEVVNHLNRGSALIEALSERVRVAELNLVAARRSKSSTAYDSALVYLSVGRVLLADDGLQQHPALAFQLDFHRADCMLLIGELAVAEELLLSLAERSARLEDRAAVTALQVLLYMSLDRSERAIEICFAYLRLVGIDWPMHPTRGAAEQEFAQIWHRLEGRPIAALIDLPQLSDAVWRATLDVLTVMHPATMFTNPNLNDMIICRMVNLSLEHGHCDASCYAYVILGFLAGPHFGSFPEGYGFGKLALDLVETRGFVRFRARVLMAFGNMVSPWTQPARNGRDLVRRAVAAAQETGDHTFVMYSFHNVVSNLLFCGDPLREVQREVEAALEFANKARMRHGRDFATTQLRLVLALRGLLPDFGSFDDTTFDEARFERYLAENPSLAMAMCFYWIRKLQARYFAGDYAGALEAAAHAESSLWAVPYFLEFADYHYFAALARAAACDTESVEKHAAHLVALTAHAAQLTALASSSSENFEDRAALVAAEIARLDGRPLAAMRLYDKALLAARHSGFVHQVAIALERAAAFYADQGLEGLAQSSLHSARECYAAWGATGKVRQLDRLHGTRADDVAILPVTHTIGAALDQLDLVTVVQMAQTISGEIVLEKLVPTLMKMALQHAGASRGLLISMAEQQPVIEAEVSTEQDELVFRSPATPPLASDLPLGICNYVSRTGSEVTLDDASQTNPFAEDRYFSQARVRSVLCLPLLKQTKLIGVLYMENALAPHVFTAARIALLKVLASQAAISLENAALYGALQREHRERSEAERKRLHSEALLEEAQRLGNTGSFRWNTETGEIAWSDGLFRLTGVDRSITPTRDLVFSSIPPEDQPAVQEALDRAISAGSTVEFEHRFLKRDGSGSMRHLRGVAQALINGDGQVEFIGSVMDLTERKAAEDSLNQMRAELAYVSRVVTLGTITASIAHEVNQPLAGITMNASACLRSLASTPPDLEAAKLAAQFILRDGFRAGDVVVRLRSLYKKTNAERVALDLNAIVNEVVELIRRELSKHAVVLRLALAEPLPEVLGDHIQLMQVLMNLTLNAIEAMSGVSERPRALAVATSEVAGGGVTVRVCDAGIGFDPPLAGRLFDAFYTSKTDGMGMGLSISRTIVESHGGRIWAELNHDFGATFQFWLPAAR